MTRLTHEVPGNPAILRMMGDDETTLRERIAKDPMLTGESRERPIPWLPEWQFLRLPKSAKELGFRLLSGLIFIAVYLLLRYALLSGLDWLTAINK